MNLFRRLLAAGGAAGLLVGVGGATQALASAPPFTAEIESACVTAGQNQVIRVTTTSQALVHIEVTIGANSVNGGTQNGTGIPDANGVFTDRWKVADVTAATTATVKIYVLTLNGAAFASGEFLIHPVTSPCTSSAPVTVTGSFPDILQVGGNVRKTCDAGVTGSATFSAVIQVKADGNPVTTVTLPAAANLTLACNGEAAPLPMLPPTSVITFHEVTLPTGAAALAADTRITIGATATTTTIHNTKKPAVVVVLPATGQPAGPPSLPWPALALLGLIAIAAAGLVLQRRS
jgi:hypothetical protein